MLCHNRIVSIQRNNGRRFGALVASLVWAIFFSAGSAADLEYKPWLEKDWTQWTKHDCSITLGASPWNQWTINTAPSSISSYTPSYGSRVQIRSALPMRQARFRLAQIEAQYEKMKPDKKKVFDLAHAHDLDPVDQVFVYIDNSSTDVSPSESAGGELEGGIFSTPAQARQAALRLPDGTLVFPTETN
jgi:hypothetical protein